jgi:hypothetical protein
MLALVSIQYVEDYGIACGGSVPYYKFKGGYDLLVRTDHEATAIGLALAHIRKGGTEQSTAFYPRGDVRFFASEEAAVESVDEWQRDSIQRA